MAALAGGCGGPGTLVDLEAWEVVSEAEDPFTDRPADVICDPIGYKVEDFEGEMGFGVETGPCPYLTARQPSLTAVSAGDGVHVRWVHEALTAPDPGEAHVAVTLDGTTIFEQRVPIPADEGELEDTWIAPSDVAEGAPVMIHLHNHGANTWGLLEVSLEPAAE